MRARSLTMVAALLVGNAAGAERSFDVNFDQRLDTVASADKIVSERLEFRQRQLSSRVRWLYKQSRGGLQQLWVDGRERRESLHRRVLARRIIARDLAEVRALREERDKLDSAEKRLDHEKRQLQKTQMPASGSVLAPVAGRVVTHFGAQVHRATGANLVNRGIRIASRSGDNVRAGIQGQVRYAGPIAGLGYGVVVEHDELSLALVIGGLSEALPVAAGTDVGPETTVGQAMGDNVYVETRLILGAGGQPVDPTPLLRFH